jgi:monoamine oxidase
MAHTSLASLFSRAYGQLQRSRRSGIPLTELVEKEAERTRQRRAFLRGAAAIGASLALPSFAHAGDTVEALAATRRQPRVAIIGGGMAGLTCAYRLKQKGVFATVYEATKRTGGRMYSDTATFAYAGQVCELGGELIDTGHKTMRRMAKEFSLTLEDRDAAQVGLRDLVGFFNGRNVPYAELVEAFTPVAEAIDTSLLDLVNSNLGITYDNANGGAALDALSLNQWFDREGLSGLGRDLVTVAHTIEWGLDPDAMNAFDMLGLISTDTRKIELFGESDERFHIKGGNQSLPRALASKLDCSQIVHERVLEQIRQRADGTYVLTFATPAGSCEVLAEHVVSALPFKTLRQVDLALDLPALKRIAINEMGYGQNTKCMTGLASRPWRTQGSNGESFSDLAYQNSWDTAQAQPQKPGKNHGILTEYTGGSRAISAGTGSLSSHVSGFLNQIDRVYPGSKAAYTGSAVRMAWNQMPYSQASYSSYLVGQYTRFAGSEGLPVGNLRFAGEHTDLDNQGYMEGAAVSGERAAKEVLNAIRSGNLTAAG